MAEFIVTDPTGKEHVVSAPEGATQEQALEYAKSQFGTTSGGAAVGNPSIESQGASANRPRVSAVSAASDIAGAGAVGATAGAFAPELLTGAAGLATIIPGAQPAVPFLLQSAAAVRGGRAVGAMAGGISGLASETAGKSVEAAGGPQWLAEGARFIGGFTQEIGIGLKAVASRMAPAPVKAMFDVAKMWTESKLGRKINPAETEQLNKMVAQLRGGPNDTVALSESVHQALTEESQRYRNGAALAAKRSLDDAEAASRKLERDALTGPVSTYRNAANEIDNVASGAAESAQASRFAIGRDVDLSTIGNELRQAIDAKGTAAKKFRGWQYSVDETAVNKIVQDKEVAGDLVEKMPEYQSLLKGLEAKTLSTKAGRMSQPLDRVGDPGLRTFYNTLRDAVRTKSLMVSETEFNEAGQAGLRTRKGTNPQTGEPAFYREFPTSFEALDNVRRKIGDAISGKPPEGYAGIAAADAREAYARIRDIQVKYGGEAQERLLDNYAGSSKELEQFMSKSGQRALAQDKNFAELYATDAQTLPAHFFKSKQGVQTAMQLTGDRDLVQQAALDFATKSVADKDSAGVRRWMTANREMLDSLGKVRLSVSEYADRLEAAERITKRAANYKTSLQTLEDRALRVAAADAESIRRTAERNANEFTKGNISKADALIGSKEVPLQIKRVLESGDNALWDLIAPAVKQSPTANAALLRLARESVADSSVKNMLSHFNSTIRYPMERTGLMTASQAADIERQIMNIQNLKIPEPEKLGRAKRIVLLSLTGAASSAASRIGTSALGIGALPEAIPSQ